MEDRELVTERETAGSDPAERPLYGIAGPRRRPRPILDLTEPATHAPTIRERWLAEARERGISAANVAPPPAPRTPAIPRLADLRADALAERFDALRDELAREIGRAVDDAVGRIQATFEREIEALRNLNKEEGKRLRATNGEELARGRASSTAELERIRTAIEDGIGNLLDVLEEELER